MFVKVAYRNGDTSIHQCQFVHVLSLSESEVAFEIEGDTYRRLDVNKNKGTEVYLMNDEGRTIDTYRWPVELKPVTLPE